MRVKIWKVQAFFALCINLLVYSDYSRGSRGEYVISFLQISHYMYMYTYTWLQLESCKNR